MKYLKFLLIFVVAVFLLTYYFKTYFPRKQIFPAEQAQQPANTSSKKWETRIDEKPPVTIQITPVELGPTANQWKFNITLTTHTGSLNQDLIKTVSLLDDWGNVYLPTVWEGPGPGGHHRAGVLTFEAINPTPSYIELKIKNVGGVPERLFKWNLK